MLKKEGIVYEQIGEYKNAVDSYEIIKKDYSDSNEGKDISKYIDRAKLEIKE